MRNLAEGIISGKISKKPVKLYFADFVIILLNGYENLKMETVGGNYHSCSFSAKIEKQGAYFKAEKVSEINGKTCTVKIYSDAEQITTSVEEGSHEACSEFCGARTSLNNLYANRKNK